jgi:hypothetical protein
MPEVEEVVVDEDVVVVEVVVLVVPEEDDEDDEDEVDSLVVPLVVSCLPEEQAAERARPVVKRRPIPGAAARSRRRAWRMFESFRGRSMLGPRPGACQSPRAGRSVVPFTGRISTSGGASV